MASFLCKAGNVKEAYEVLQEMEKKKQARSLFCHMLQWGVEPDGNTYIILLKGFCQDKELEAALEVFKKCFERAEYIRKIIIYLCKEGHFTTASDLVLNCTSTIKNLVSNMILQKYLVDAGEVLVAIEHVKKVGEMSARMLHEPRAALLSSVSSTSKPQPILKLIQVYNDYGTMVDVFIPNKKSKAGKRFAFVRFIKVLNFDRLIENLKTIWISRFHLSANPVRFDRPKAHTFQKDKPVSSGNVTGFRQPNVQYHGGSNVTISTPPFLLKPTLVLDDSCLVNMDLVNCVMGEVLQFSSINNLRVLLSNEGFHYSRIVYLGGLWVMIELKSSKTKLKFMQHVGVASWFRRLCNAQPDFAAKERIVWVDIEEDGYDDLFARKRICIKTSQMENILESFKIIVKGKVLWARAKELFVWSPSFKEVPEKVICSDDESIKINEEANSLNNGVEESDSDVVSDTYFGDNGEDQGFEHQHGESYNAKDVSSDPFNIYGLLDKRTKEVRTTDTTTSISYPPGFTPVNEILASIKKDAPNSVDKSSSKSINNGINLKEDGSILEILEEMITVGQTIGFSMEGSKDMEKIIETQGEQVVFR
nr:RNA-directed DNA polymerase, eukaryota, nucleotide-binding alpha-beta plait domain protein [Tanacetum cinerariifolium]